jgi:hypothetical protein
MRAPRAVTAWFLLVIAAALPAAARQVSQRGSIEATGLVYPLSSPSGDDRWIGDVLFRQEASWRPVQWLSLAGAFDARAATNDWVDRSWAIDWSDRGLKRPALAVRRMSLSVHRGGLTLDAGKQLVRWGKADILNPTDRFAPRDLLEVVDNEVLAVTAARLTYERGTNTIDLVFSPRLTPSRLPLADGRWAPSLASGTLPGSLPLGAADWPVVVVGSNFPTRPQTGVRWNHVGSGFEYSFSAYDGFNNLPASQVSVNPIDLRFEVTRTFPAMRMVGGDMAWPCRWFTLKGEAGYFWTTDPTTDDYAIYVVQAERQTGEWMIVGGYAGEFVTTTRSALPAQFTAFDRGLAKTFLGRASYTIDVNRSLAFEGAVRQNGRGFYVKAEYSQAVGQHWRATARADVIGGALDDFLGQYRRNSSARLTFRYSY